ncbi:MAG: AAA family ATPase [Pseudomonadota bacterium]
MINVTEIPMDDEDIEEVRLWGLGYRQNAVPEVPWPQFSKESGVAQSTLHAFVTGKYQGNRANVARKLFAFRQAVEATTKRQEQLPENPGFFETQTSRRLHALLEIAHMGRITVAATGPGTGKTMTIEDYRQKAQPTFVATLRPSTSTLNQFIMQVQKALAMDAPRLRAGSAAVSSLEVVERLASRNALLIIDEANYASIEAIEEARSWHDETGVGICFMGNEELLARIETGKHRDQLARLNRRIAMRHIQRLPLPEDVHLFCDAWGVVQNDIRAFLEKIALTPDAGGLGECQQLIEAASMLADSEDRGLALSDMRDAQASRSTRWIKT